MTKTYFTFCRSRASFASCDSSLSARIDSVALRTSLLDRGAISTNVPLAGGAGRIGICAQAVTDKGSRGVGHELRLFKETSCSQGKRTSPAGTAAGDVFLFAENYCALVLLLRSSSGSL